MEKSAKSNEKRHTLIYLETEYTAYYWAFHSLFLSLLDTHVCLFFSVYLLAENIHVYANLINHTCEYVYLRKL